MSLDSSHDKDCPADCAEGKLMVSGSIRLDHDVGQNVEVRRGMSIWTSDDQEAGNVAALVVRHEGEPASYILLGRLPEVMGYLCIHVDLIQKVENESVCLLVPSQEVNSLPAWRSNT